VAGVPCAEGLRENVDDKGLDGAEEEGSELRVPVGDPSGVKMAGRSVVAALRDRRYLVDFRNSGNRS
jgi:hypothetical protein